jgi:hypothetical protein
MLRGVRRFSLYKPVIFQPLWSVAMQDEEGVYHQQQGNALQHKQWYHTGSYSSSKKSILCDDDYVKRMKVT